MQLFNCMGNVTIAYSELDGARKAPATLSQTRASIVNRIVEHLIVGYVGVTRIYDIEIIARTSSSEA